MTEETRIALLEQSIAHVGDSLHRLESKLDKIESELGGSFKWLAGVVVSIGLSLAAWIHLH